MRFLVRRLTLACSLLTAALGAHAQSVEGSTLSKIEKAGKA